MIISGRIPLLIDNTQSPPRTIMETSAELLYLLEFYDQDSVFGFTDKWERSQAFQWLAHWHGSGAPTMMQLNHFGRVAQEKIPCTIFPSGCVPSWEKWNLSLITDAIDHFQKEVMRLIGTLEIRLSGKYTGEPREYLAGNGRGKYSIADIETWPYVRLLKSGAFPHQVLEAFPHVEQWIDRIAARPAAQRAIGAEYSTSLILWHSSRW